MKTRVDCEAPQEVLSKLSEWATLRQMKLYMGKYKVMHTGTKITNLKGIMLGFGLPETELAYSFRG